ncbi:somatic embryogenesis receptor kinase precursor [Trifolium repens]|nr:somatic embryogenesis receptor kinase precursor [Trifolium repens]
MTPPITKSNRRGMLRVEVYQVGLLGPLEELSSLQVWRLKMLPLWLGYGNHRALLSEARRLNNNKLTGRIPRELTKLRNLKIIDLSNNDLSLWYLPHIRHLLQLLSTKFQEQPKTYRSSQYIRSNMQFNN